MLFLQQSNTQEVLCVLERAVKLHQIVPFVGCASTGKTWLLTYLATQFWKLERKTEHLLPRIAYAELYRPRGSQGAKDVASPVARVAFSELTLGLAQISRQYDSRSVHEARLWYKKDRSESADKQFTLLFPFVCDELNRLNIDALIIDNAEHLDLFTIARLRQMREFLKHRLALILCARIEKPNELNPTLAESLPKVFDTLEIERPQELARLKPEEVMGSVLLRIMADQKLTFGSDLSRDTIGKMREQFYQDTQGDWKSIAVRQRRMRSLFGDSNGTVRYLGQKEWEQIMGKPLLLKN